ncbi:acetyl-CoA synthetase-like protein [Aulographum hederae CBS 113979]|uniref:Very long-chain fatty acid transport protein n=1 Tax=Aulographum hederae CBS 113979 TaxID=1176131 RepID=A0A6G1HEV3_9PEZI|nr:acetyl-CoA synthetase-like protein [Aulographum hederae CBS 113979]
MALATTAAIAAITATTAAAAYLDAKFHIRKDLRVLGSLKHGDKLVAEAEAKNRMSLWYPFEAQAQRIPNEDCLWSREGTYTWRETYAQGCRYAQFFLSQGIKPKSLVAFYLTNTPEFILAMLGSWAVGTAPANINYNLAGNALIHCLRVSGSKIVLVDEDSDCRARIEESRDRIERELGMKIVVLDAATKAQIGSLPSDRPKDELRSGLKGEFPMCLLYTSGSTGHPKACPFPVSRGFYLAGPRLAGMGLKPQPNGDRWYDCMPLYHGTGNTTAVACLTGGLTLCIGKKFSTSGFWNEIRASKATAFVYVGETARYLLAAKETPQDKEHNVRVMYGNGMRPDVWMKFRQRFGIETVVEFFNSTEGVFALQNTSNGEYLANAVGHHGALLRFATRQSYIPVLIDHETGKIWRDPKTGFAKRNSFEEGGEILCKVEDESGFAGYWGNSEATKKMFERNVFVKGDMYYRTGDALRRTSDGRWFFLDRLGDTFRWKSENVSTAEVAEVLGHFPGIVEAIVYGALVPGHDGRAGCAALFIDPKIDPSTYPAFFRSLLDHCRQKLPRYAVPVFLRLQNAMSPMHNQKQNKIPLKKEGIDLDQVYGEGMDLEEGVKAGKDGMMWLPSSLDRKGRDEYVAYRQKDWEGIQKAAKSKL